MSLAPSLINADKEQPEAKTLSIEIEPSYPLIMATIQFFRAQKKPRQSLELCRRGLNYFPGDLGLRLGLAMAYLDLKEKDKAWTEIKAVAEQLNQLAPIMDSISTHFRQIEQNNLSEWFTLVAQALSKYPAEGLEIKSNIQTPSFSLKDELETSPDCLVVEKLPTGDLEAKRDSQILDKEASLFPQGENKSEAETAREALGDSNVLSTLTGWLSQLKSNKA
ncbi:MAG: hypothetical protein MUQ20_03670 [Deltaproteobacteria bacterium]|nr:hypothetical protein [Deltaproteobacteria bacterium]